MNAVASAILDATADADTQSRRERLRARAAGLGMLNRTQAPRVSAQDRERILASTRGLGQIADRILAEERDPLL